MDPSIIKLLEDDEDEILHSSADVEALSAALNRDLTGDSLRQNESSAETECQQNVSSSELVIVKKEIEKEKKHFNICEEQSSLRITATEFLDQHANKLKKLNDDRGQFEVAHDQEKLTEQNPLQCFTIGFSRNFGAEEKKTMQLVNSSQAPVTSQVNNPTKQTKNSISCDMLLQFLQPNLDKDKNMQLSTVFNKFKKSELSDKDFLRFSKDLVGDQMLKNAALQVVQNLEIQLQASQNSQRFSSESTILNQTSQVNGILKPPEFAKVDAQEHSATAKNQQYARVPSHQLGVSVSANKTQIVTCSSGFQNINQHCQGFVNKSDGKMSYTVHTSFNRMNGKPNTQPPQTYLPTPCQTANKPIGHAYPGGSGASLTRVKSENVDLPVEHTNVTHDKAKVVCGVPFLRSTKLPMLKQNSIPPRSMSIPKGEIKGNTLLDSNLGRKGMLIQGMGLTKTSALVSQGSLQESKDVASRNHNLITKTSSQVQTRTARCPHAAPPVSNSAEFPQGAPVGQKRPVEGHGPATTLTSKRQKTSEALLDQTSGTLLDQSNIEQLNDVTTVSGINLREEEEQLRSMPKEDNRVSEETQRLIQAEEKISRCHLEQTSCDVEHCLSMCVEERLRGLINSLIRISKQRVDNERTRHRTVVTSDVRCQIMEMNQKAKEDWGKMQAAETTKLQKPNEIMQTNKVDDDIMRTNAANVAARAAVGGDDMLIKWQLMAEQARLRREGLLDETSNSDMVGNMNHKVPVAHGRVREHQTAEKQGPSACALSGGMSRFGRIQTAVRHPKVVRGICARDVIAVLERETQMSRTALIYRLYERLTANSTVKQL